MIIAWACWLGSEVGFQHDKGNPAKEKGDSLNERVGDGKEFSKAVCPNLLNSE